MSQHRNLDKFLADFRTRQRNVVFPDAVRNARPVDAFFWKGSPHPPLVQRIAAWMFGLVFMGGGMEIFSRAVQERVEAGFSASVVFMVLVSLSLVLLGMKVFRNGFPRHAKPTGK
jgi:ammonia channel protein AmtB